MEFCWSTIKVKDMEETLKFYKEIIGLKVNRRFQAGPGVDIAFLGNGETELEFIYDENNKNVDFGSDISWGFEVDSLDEILKLLEEKGIELDSEIISPNPSIKFFYISDPNGLKIQLVENMAL